MSSPYPELGHDIATEATPPQTNFDPGQGDIANSGEYTGMPVINPNELHTEQPPETFDQAHPELSYTNKPPRQRPTPVRTAPARSFRTRQVTLNPGADPIMILSRNPERWKAYLTTSNTTVQISDDPAALVGLITGGVAPGSGLTLPTVAPYPFESTAELFAACMTGVAVVGIMEYIDD